jgi:ATP-dependent DNA helicase RecG
MTFSFLGPDPVERQIEELLSRLSAGEPPNQVEPAQVDVKEEPGRRGADGTILDGSLQN